MSSPCKAASPELDLPACVFLLLVGKAKAFVRDETVVILVFVPPVLSISSSICCMLKS